LRPALAHALPRLLPARLHLPRGMVAGRLAHGCSRYRALPPSSGAGLPKCTCILQQAADPHHISGVS
jgi:hypothetical protein